MIDWVWKVQRHIVTQWYLITSRPSHVRFNHRIFVFYSYFLGDVIEKMDKL